MNNMYETYGISESTKDSLDRYVNHRIQPGGFLTAVLSNDLVGAVGRADSFNKKVIPEIITYIYNQLPSNCWGSSEKVQDWLNGVK